MAKKSKRASKVPVRSTKEGFAPVVASAPGSDYVVVELRYESPVAYAATGFAASDGGEPESQSLWYTLRFSGTSSASPMVTGAVACLQGHAFAKNGAPLSPAKVRSILMATGTPQVAGPGVPLAQRIGPQPNLVRALAQV